MFGPDLDGRCPPVNTPFSIAFYDAVRQPGGDAAPSASRRVRDAGGADLGVKTAVERGLDPGPRMQISISMLSQTGGHGDGWTRVRRRACRVLAPTTRACRTRSSTAPTRCASKVRELVRGGRRRDQGGDVSGGVLSPRDDPRHGHFRDDELEVLVAEATAAGKFVMAHAQATDGIKAAMRTGIRSIEHGIYLDDEAIEMMLDARARGWCRRCRRRAACSTRGRRGHRRSRDVVIKKTRDGHRGAHASRSAGRSRPA